MSNIFPSYTSALSASEDLLNNVCSRVELTKVHDVHLFFQGGGRLVSRKRARKLCKLGEYVRWSPYFKCHCWVTNMNGWGE